MNKDKILYFIKAYFELEEIKQQLTEEELLETQKIIERKKDKRFIV